MVSSIDRIQGILEGHELEASRLLIADYQEAVVRVLVRVLEDENLSILTAPDGNRAVELIRVHSFDLILTDIVMPGASGIAILKEAKSRNPETEVIMMTGNASVGSAAESVRLGAADYLLKPFDNLQAVRFSVKRALTRRALVRLARQYSSEIQETNRKLKAQRDQYENLAEIVHVGSSRVVRFLNRLSAMHGDQLPEGLRVERDALRQSEAEMIEVIDQFLAGETSTGEQPAEKSDPPDTADPAVGISFPFP